jgi:hypothetical protein
MQAALPLISHPPTHYLQDVYQDMPWHLKEQMQETMAVLKRHPQLGVPH